MSKKHEIDLLAVMGYAFESVIAASHGKGDSKMLKAIVEGRHVRYEVTSHGEIIVSTNDVTTATEAYNRN